LVDQRCGVECLPRFLVSELLGRQLPKLVVDQRQELIGGLRIALLNGGQDSGDFAHRSSGPAEAPMYPECNHCIMQMLASGFWVSQRRKRNELNFRVGRRLRVGTSLPGEIGERSDVSQAGFYFGRSKALASTSGLTLTSL